MKKFGFVYAASTEGVGEKSFGRENRRARAEAGGGGKKGEWGGGGGGRGNLQTNPSK